MNVLELFSGTHSIGKVLKKEGYNIISLDRDIGGECPLNSGYDNSSNHIQEDILKWDYKIYPPGHFKLITASPVCLWWSSLRNTWIGRKMKSHGETIITKEILENDINIYGKPMIDKVIEIIEYFQPTYWWIENPSTGKMKHYIEEKYPEYNVFFDFDYCKYSDFGYKKASRFWTNIPNINPLKCKNDCGNLFYDEETKRKKHRLTFGSYGRGQKCIGGGGNRLERYRIPEVLIKHLIKTI